MIIERTVNKEIEKRIITGMIVSTPFLREIIPIMKLEYFDVDYARIVAGWIKKYYDEYKSSPGVHIQDIYNFEKANLKPELADLIASFLQELSNRFSLEGEDFFNVEYLLDQAQYYFKKQALLRTTEITRGLLLEGKVEEAEKEWTKYKGIYRETSRWIYPFSEDFVEKVLSDEEEGLFTLPGKLGELGGPWKRGWLVTFMGPRKRGKSWFLIESALWAVIEGLRVVFFSLEMTDTGVGNRMLKRLTSLADKKGFYLYPVFDCLKNQDGSCKKPERVNRQVVIVNGRKLSFEEAPKNYEPCTKCRGTRDFVVGAWWESLERERLSFKKAMTKIAGFETMYGMEKKFRMMTYPAFSANLYNIRSDLDKLEEMEGFVPDLVVIDYADILRPEFGREVTIETIGQTWMEMKSLAAEKRCIVLTATQTTRKSAEKKEVKHTDAAWDIRKMDHVDLAYALSQTEYEKRQKRMRISVVAHRWADFDESRHVIVLQQLEMGQPLLDSEYGELETGEEYFSED